MRGQPLPVPLPESPPVPRRTGNKNLIVMFCLLSVVVAGVLQMADGQILTIVPRVYTQSPGQKPQNGQPPRGPNALLPKKVIAVLQAAQLLPTD
jgi:hypothetical protein